MRRVCGLLIGMALCAPAVADEPLAAYPPMPEAFSSFGAAVADGYVYVYGGHIAKTHTYSTEAVTGKFRRLHLTKAGAAWEELPTGPALQGLALVAHGGKLYRIGGMHPKNKPGDKADLQSVASSAVYDPKTGKWSDLPVLPGPRSSHDAVVVGDLLVIVGGWDMKGNSEASPFHETSLVLDLSQKSPEWKSVPQPFRRRAFNAAAIEGKIYVVGGMNSDNEVEKTVDIFDPKAAAWSTGPALPGPKKNGFSAAVCADGDKLFASPADGKVYRLADKRDAWTEVATLATIRIVHRIVPRGDAKLVALGGATTEANLATVEAVEPTPAAPKVGAATK